MTRVAAHRPNPRIRVLLVDRDAMGTQLLAGALKRGRTNFEVTTLVGNSPESNQDWADLKPDVAVVSAEPQDRAQLGFLVLQKLRQAHPRTPVIMLFHARNQDLVIDAFRRGARGVFYRHQTYKALAKCIRVVHRGQIWASNEDIESILAILTQFKPLQMIKFEGGPRLTRREQDVVRLVAEGMSNPDIGRALRIAEHSVRNYLSAIFKKLDVTSRVELVLYAIAQRKAD